MKGAFLYIDKTKHIGIEEVTKPVCVSSDILIKIKVIIGGAPVTQSYADEIGADSYAPDVASAVDTTNKQLIEAANSLLNYFENVDGWSKLSIALSKKTWYLYLANNPQAKKCST